MEEGDNFALIVVFISACTYRCIPTVWKYPLFTE
jgi:hypothetical protein